MLKKTAILGVFTMLWAGFSYAQFYVGATRVIHQVGGKSQSITVANKSDQIVYLVQSWISDYANDKNNKKFIVTLPLFRLNESTENIIRIVHTSALAKLPQDRESVFWLNIKAMPGDKTPAENKLTVVFKNQLKLFFRPMGMVGSADGAYKQIGFSRQGNQLVVANTTAYHVTFTAIKAGGANVLKEPVMIAPKDQLNLPLSSANVRSISWQTINDYGGTTPEKSAVLTDNAP